MKPTNSVEELGKQLECQNFPRRTRPMPLRTDEVNTEVPRHDAEQKNTQIEIVLLNGRRILVPSGINLELLSRLLPVVEG